jgi:hypothetical protein
MVKIVPGGARTRLCLFESSNAFYCVLLRLVAFEKAGSHQKCLKSMTFHCSPYQTWKRSVWAVVISGD